MSTLDSSKASSGLNVGKNMEGIQNQDNNTSRKERRRKRRWGDASSSNNALDSATQGTITTKPTSTNSQLANTTTGPLDSKAKALALQESIRARLAALKAKTGEGYISGIGSATSSSVSSLKRPPPPLADASPQRQDPNKVVKSSSSQRPTKRAKHYELDMSITGPTYTKEASSVIIKKPAKKINPYLAHREEESEDQALASSADAIKQPSLSPQPESNYIDERLEQLGIVNSSQKGANRRQRRELHFVEPGTFVEIAERKRQRAANAESAGFVSGRKTGQFVKSTSMMASSSAGSSNYYGTTEILDAVTDLGVLPSRPEAGNEKETGKSGTISMPLVVEWWDMELLPPKLKKQVANFEGKTLSKEAQSQMEHLSSTKPISFDNKKLSMAGGAATIATMSSPEALELRTKCTEQTSLSYSKTADLIQHIVPVKPPNAKDDTKVEPVLRLTKKELKRQRKLRRQEKQRELQDLQAAGLVPPPEPRLTLKNFIRVLGDQAYVDPSQMEQKVLEQVQARQRAHLERNEAKKLTKEQRAEKRRKKFEEDTSKTGIHVALFYVKNMSHPYHRTKVDLNAQQFNITGGVVECKTPHVACVICEGGPKAIQKYSRLMLVRMKWKGPDSEDEEEDGGEEEEGQDVEEGTVIHRFDKENKCELVWTGMATKRFFKGFVFQAVETSDQARKILRSKGVGHYWDQVLAQASGQGESLHLKLADTDDEEDSDYEKAGTKGEEDMDVEMVDP